MVPTTKEALSKLVTETTVEIYEELTPQLIQLIDQTKHNDKLTEVQKQDEISLHMMGYVKSYIISRTVINRMIQGLYWFRQGS